LYAITMDINLLLKPIYYAMIMMTFYLREAFTVNDLVSTRCILHEESLYVGKIESINYIYFR